MQPIHALHFRLYITINKSLSTSSGDATTLTSHLVTCIRDSTNDKRMIQCTGPQGLASKEKETILHTILGSYFFSTRKPLWLDPALPPIIVLMSEAWPGQSTRVYWRLGHCGAASRRCSGISTEKDEKPRSRVMPRSLLWGFLSKLAVLSTVLRALDKLVFPLSTWPSTPTLKLKVAII